ncbi:MAG: ABC transporter ATP-binding protein [Acidiferrobacterales bacterium]|nr:ABC transporter ATP-binding protein [Acidiferrobacterales bacterium]
MTTLLTTRQLVKRFGGLNAVAGVDFTLEKGEIHALIGPNGAGKTTFVSLLCGRLEATEGSIFFKGKEITEMPAWKRVRAGIAYTFQITSIYSNLTVFQNAAIAAQHANKPADDAEQRAKTALEKVGLAAYASHEAGSLAYGHQRVLEVAMGIALEPELLILDEPTQGLSDLEIEQFCGLIREINQQTTVLLIEHNMQVVMSLARQISVMDQGLLLAQGTPDEIQANAAVQSAYLGTIDEENVA